MLEAVAAPIVAALVGAPPQPATVSARLAAPVTEPGRVDVVRSGRARRMMERGPSRASPCLRSFSVSLAARADGYIVMDERDDEWPAAYARDRLPLFRRLSSSIRDSTYARRRSDSGDDAVHRSRAADARDRSTRARASGRQRKRLRPLAEGGRRDARRADRALVVRRSRVARSARRAGGKAPLRGRNRSSSAPASTT